MLYEALDPENPRGSLQLKDAAQPLSTGTETQLSTDYVGKPLYLMVSGTGTFTVGHYLTLEFRENDFIPFATTLTGERGTVTTDNLQATNTTDEPALPSSAVPMKNIVWFKWTPSFTGLAGFDTNFSYLNYAPADPLTGSMYDLQPYMHETQIALYAATSTGANPTLNPLFSNANSGFFNINSRLTYTVISGQTYYIAVGTKGGPAATSACNTTAPTPLVKFASAAIWLPARKGRGSRSSMFTGAMSAAARLPAPFSRPTSPPPQAATTPPSRKR